MSDHGEVLGGNVRGDLGLMVVEKGGVGDDDEGALVAEGFHDCAGT